MDIASGESSGGIMDMTSLRSRRLGTYTHSYTRRDAMLYALGLGCTAVDDLRYVYEGAEDFAVLPTYAIVAAHPALGLVPLESYLPGGLDRTAALHGEQYLELLGQPLPPKGGRLVTRPQLTDVQAKGNGLVIVLRTITTDLDSGRDIAINEFTTFVLRKSGIRTPWAPAPRTPAAVASNDPPTRPPDVIITARTSPDQAALYRLSGDYNPLHIDPSVSGRLGFPKPILHGLCTLGISVRHVLRKFGGDNPTRLKSVKVRFSKHVLPGETLRVEMWREDETHASSNTPKPLNSGKLNAPSNTSDTSIPSTSSATHAGAPSGPPGKPIRVIFRTWVEERAVLAITNAAVELWQPKGPTPPSQSTLSATSSTSAAITMGSRSLQSALAVEARGAVSAATGPEGIRGALSRL